MVETNPLLRPLLREAARSCINPNLWFMETTWSRGMISNHASHRRLFLPAHQPNRRWALEWGLAKWEAGGKKRDLGVVLRGWLTGQVWFDRLTLPCVRCVRE